MAAASPEIATNRFGLGARPGEIAAARKDPRGWLEAQIGPLVFDTKPGSAAAVLRELPREMPARKRQSAQAKALARRELQAARKRVSAIGNRLVRDTLVKAIASDRSFASRLLDFFSNHFSVSTKDLAMRGLAPTLEREAIAPHLAGRFEDMLLAVTRHPAMLVYLDNRFSVGPESAIGKRRSRGLNENLAREILELHTLGVDGGYGQSDVRELAMAITGWSVELEAHGQDGNFLFRSQAHAGGSRRLLGRRYPEGGQAQGEAMLRELARHPSTARHVSWKLVRHLLTDEPPAALVDAMAVRWLATGGAIAEVLRTLLRHPLAWEPEARKLKTPREFLISTLRALGTPPRKPAGFTAGLVALGQPPFGAGSPAGYPDIAAAWDGAEALLNRIDWVESLAEEQRGVEALGTAESALGSQVAPRTRAALRGAASRAQALALLFMSPEFQRR
ncbi:MAG: DUF1800 family protein [Gammaproteobacteria bacterium]